MDRASIVLTTLIVYQVVLVLIGIWAQRRTASNEDFFVGGRNLGGMVASLSYAAGSSSAWTLLGVSGAAFTTGLSALWMFPGIMAGHMVCWFWIAPRLRRMATDAAMVTLTDVLVANQPRRSALPTRALASAIIVFCFLFYVASQFQAAGNTLGANFAISPVTATIVGATIIMIYTFLGGFWAVSITDALQGGLMAIAAILLPLAAIFAVGGPLALITTLEAVAPPQYLELFGNAAGMAALGLALGLMTIGLGSFGQPHLLNRFMALKNERELVRGRRMALSWFAVVLAGMLLLGLCARALMPEAQDGEAVFFGLTESLLPSVIGAVVTAAVLSAIMSTADSQLLVTASAVSNDFGVRKLIWSRVAMLGVGVAAVALAILAPASIFSRVLFAWNGLGSAFGPLVFALLSGRKLATWTPLCAMSVGIASTIVLHLQPNTPGDWAERIIPFALATIIVLVGSRRPTILTGKPTT